MHTFARKFAIFYLFSMYCSSVVTATEFSVKVVDQNGNPLADAAVETNAKAVSGPVDEIAVIDQINKRFVPKVIAVQKGQRVTFPNKDNIRHHVYSFSPIRQFSTELYADVPGEPILFDNAGIATLGCNIHDSMVGYIFVSEWSNVDTSNADGMVYFSTEHTPSFVNVWHPWSSLADKQQRVELTGLVEGDELIIEMQIDEPNQSFGFKALRED